MTNVAQNGCLTPEKKSRSRPPSYAGGGGTGSGDSPVTLRSRSSTCDSLQSGSSPSASTNRQQMPPPPPPQARKPVAGKSLDRRGVVAQILCWFRRIVVKVSRIVKWRSSAYHDEFVSELLCDGILPSASRHCVRRLFLADNILWRNGSSCIIFASIAIYLLPHSTHAHGAGHFNQHPRLAEKASSTATTAGIHGKCCCERRRVAIVALWYATHVGYVDAQSYDQRTDFSRPHFTHSTAYVEHTK